MPIDVMTPEQIAEDRIKRKEKEKILFEEFKIVRPKLKKQIVDFLKQHEGSAFLCGEIGSGCGIIPPGVLPGEESYSTGTRVVERVFEYSPNNKIWSRSDQFTNLESEWEGIYLKENDRGTYFYYSSSEELNKDRHEREKKYEKMEKDENDGNGFSLSYFIAIIVFLILLLMILK